MIGSFQLHRIIPSSQAHWQVAQTDTRPKPAKELAFQTQGLNGIKHETLTNGIVHAGFIGLREFAARKKSRFKLIGFSLVIPHDTIPSTVGHNTDKTLKYQIYTLIT